jgi:hypothetical protein
MNDVRDFFHDMAQAFNNDFAAGRVQYNGFSIEWGDTSVFDAKFVPITKENENDRTSDVYIKNRRYNKARKKL